LEPKEERKKCRHEIHPRNARESGSVKKYCNRGCQTVYVYFQTKNHNLGKFWSVLQWKMLVNIKAIWSILLPFGILYGHLEHFVVSLVYFCRFWVPMSYQEKSGNPDRNRVRKLGFDIYPKLSLCMHM
jgi:hypothetical protein